MEEESLSAKKEKVSDQEQLDLCAEGFQVESLKRLVGPDAASYTAGLEDLYEKMLAKVESLARLVESSSAQVLELVSFGLMKTKIFANCRVNCF